MRCFQEFYRHEHLRVDTENSEGGQLQGTRPSVTGRKLQQAAKHLFQNSDHSQPLEEGSPRKALALGLCLLDSKGPLLQTFGIVCLGQPGDPRNLASAAPILPQSLSGYDFRSCTSQHIQIQTFKEICQLKADRGHSTKEISGTPPSKECTHHAEVTRQLQPQQVPKHPLPPGARWGKI